MPSSPLRQECILSSYPPTVYLPASQFIHAFDSCFHSYLMILHDLASEQLLEPITVSLLRTHAYGLLQCHLFILHPPKAHLHLIQMQPKFSLLASQTRHQFCHRGVLCFHRSARYRSLPEFLILRAQLVSVLSLANPLPNPSSLESCTTQATVQQGH